MQQYLNLIQDVLNNGTTKTDRTGTGTIAVFGRQLRFNLQNGFPLVTTKKVHLKSIIYELLWFLHGDTNTKYLNDNGVKIWNEWANENGDLGRIYGYQWRKWQGYNGEHIDQISNLIQNIKSNPNSRRHVISAWNVADLDKMALLPCHFEFIFNVIDDKLSCMMTMRSCDIGLGLPFNIASYAILTSMIAQVCQLKVGDLVISLGDAHIYLNHIEHLKKQIQRQPLKLPQLKLNPNINNIDNFNYEDIKITDYKTHSHIKMPISI
jgi:thymidylate synthase